MTDAVDQSRTMNNPYEDANELQHLYGRFEHALKRADHLKKNRKDAQADWNSFARALGDDFFEEVRCSGVADTLINNPPRKLMADLTWRPEHPPRLANVEGLFIQGVCRVRNSYIHHEKFIVREQLNRDATLVHEALAVLRLAESKRTVDLP